MAYGVQSPASLFVGRWQPFHDGHKALIETVLKKGKPVIVAIRDTEMSHKNPYTVAERWTMIQKALVSYSELVKIVVLPDIDEICYGRDVGYGIRKIELDGKLQKISGTKARKKSPPTLPIIWLTGQSGAGKTTLAEALNHELNGVILDGDEMRKTISVGLGFSKEDREEHNIRVARLAQTLAKRSYVVVSVIAPFRSTRKKIDEIIKPVWVYIRCPSLVPREDRPYEYPVKPNVSVDSDNQSTAEQLNIILDYLKSL
jgi:cytidyltransferase-like protein